MKKLVTLCAVILTVILVAVTLTGCAGHPKGMKSPRELTGDEKDRVIEIALNIPEVLKW